MTERRKVKVWRASTQGETGMIVTEKAAMVVGNSKNFLVASAGGIGLVGRSVSFGTTGENIRQGGLFVQMNDFLQMIPSTIVTPQPKLMPFPPMGLIATAMKDIPVFMAMLA